MVQQFVSSKTNATNAAYNAQTKGNMFVFTHGDGPNQVTEYRYIGDAPNNYVKFNCDDDGTNCEVWRILGVFDVDDGSDNIEQRIKLVRGQSLPTEMMWDDDTDGTLSNDWNEASLQYYLNGDCLYNSGDALQQGFGLKSSAQNIIDDAKYYLGADNYDYTVEGIYAWERGDIYCSSCDMNENELYWLGKVGLMYPSDQYMVYGNGVNGTCYTDTNGCTGSNAQTGWVYNSNIVNGNTPVYTWLLSPLSTSLYFSFESADTGYLTGVDVNAIGGNGVRPVVYLSSTVQVVDGDGTIGNPYVLQ